MIYIIISYHIYGSLIFVGMYWVDPNAGNPVDALEVFCDMDNQQTCVLPKPSQVFKGQWYEGPEQHVWFGEEMEEGFPVIQRCGPHFLG